MQPACIEEKVFLKLEDVIKLIKGWMKLSLLNNNSAMEV